MASGCSDLLGICHSTAQPEPPSAACAGSGRAGQGRAGPGRCCLPPRASPGSWAQILCCLQPNAKRRKKSHCVHVAKMSSGLLESAVSSSLIIIRQTDRQTWRTDRPSSIRSCLWAVGQLLGTHCIWKNTSLQRCYSKAGIN